MTIDRIDFIASYCDRWCERCAYTRRCSSFVCEAAEPMCGDPAQGFELAVGTPRPDHGEADPETPARLAALLDAASARETTNCERQEAARRARLGASPITKTASAYWPLSLRWMEEHYDRVSLAADPIVLEALQVIQHDTLFIGAKLHRALDGLDRHCHDERDDDLIQNDWNGSAKVALISLERSEAAWRVVSEATPEPSAAAALVLAEALKDLHQLVCRTFPRAMLFVRPGFDEPWR